MVPQICHLRLIKTICSQYSQFFTGKIVNKLVERTNKYVELRPLNDAGEKLRARPCISDHDDFDALIRLAESLSITSGRISAG